ncbi:NADH-quinone oxidoreductase [Crepidotus variabilis]|uniref:NADH-quinone oxidoreductase n=1 Tax=Crepidotus variabilis TaxID=179855 RepID=A0A9P6E800_9AGAR|nr:NADH-quinone oxidoreductase [Crepidotus variabilis]
MCFPSKKQKNNFTDETPKAPIAENGEKKKVVEPTATASTDTKTEPPVPKAEPTSDVKIAEPSMSSPKIAIVIYSMYGHIQKLAEAEKAGIEAAGGKADIYQVPETLSEEVLGWLKAPPKPDFPVITPDILATYDAFLMGIPTRYGNMPGQWKAFWDATGYLWAKGSLAGKYAGLFLSTASMGGGQESTAIAMMSTLSHHGILYVPLGYSRHFAQASNVTEPHGGGPWGAGTLAGPDGSRQPSELELDVAKIQGGYFYELVSKVNFSKL